MAIDKKVLNNIKTMRDLNNDMSLDTSNTSTDFNKALAADNKKLDDITNRILEYGNRDHTKSTSDIKNLANIFRSKETGKVKIGKDDLELVNHINQIYQNPEQLTVYQKEYNESLLRNRVYDDYDLIMKFLPITKSQDQGSEC